MTWGKIYKFILLMFLLKGLSISVVKAQSGLGQEVGDVVYHQLKIFGIDYMHGAIYKGYIRKGGAAEDDFNHDVIEMTGVTNKKLCGRILCVEQWEGIKIRDLKYFKKKEPPYHGASSPKRENFDKKIRAQVVEVAEYLMTLPIPYIVIENDSVFDIETNYFRYKDSNADGKISDDEIERMRSDAFVEYCYAAVGVPIMADNITLKSGADALISAAHNKTLYPFSQRGNMEISMPDIPEIKVTEAETGRIIPQGALTSKTLLNITITDIKSGPAKLEIYAPPSYASLTPMAIRPFYTGTGEVNKQTSYEFTKDIGELSPGPVILQAYDFGGNRSVLSFDISDDPIFSGPGSPNPLYTNFKGISTLNPSTIHRDHSMYFSDDIAGISSVLVAGPQGNVINWAFDPPVSSTYTYIRDMAIGQYSVKIINSVGLETIAPFNIQELNVYVSTPLSSQTYMPNQGTYGAFTVKIAAIAESSAELDRIELLNSSWNVVGVQQISGNKYNVYFDLPLIELSTAPFVLHGNEELSDNPQKYYLRVFDKYGNTKIIRVSLPYLNLFMAQRTLTDFFKTSYQYSFPIIDITSCVVEGWYGPYGYGDYITFLPGVLYSNYKATDPRGTPGYTFYFNGIRGDLNLSGPSGKVEEVGQGQMIIKTGNLPNLSDGSDTIIDSGDLFLTSSYASSDICQTRIRIEEVTDLCFNPKPPMHILPLKRYVRAECIFNKQSPTHIIDENCWSKDPVSQTCIKGYDIDISCNNSIDFAGFSILYQHVIPTNLYAGDNITIPLSSNVTITFNKIIDPGTVVTSISYNKPPSGFISIPQNTVYNVDPSGLKFQGNAKIIFKYDSNGLSDIQENQIKIVKVIDSVSGKYEELPSTVDTINKKVSTIVTSFSPFMVVVPEYSNPQEIKSVNLVNGLPEMKFISGITATQNLYDMNTEVGQNILKAMKSMDKLPVSNVYEIGPITALEPAGAIKMRYSDGDIAAFGVDENSLELYEFTEDGQTFTKLPYLTLDTENNVLTAKVSTLPSLFAILASSRQAENIPPSVYPDGIPPETTINFYGPTSPAAEGPYVSTRTNVVFTANDPQIPDVITSGVKLTNYILDSSETELIISTYTEPFTLIEGSHTIYYMSSDNAGNYEFPKSIFIRADGTPPISEIQVYGSSTTDAQGNLVISTDSFISFVSIDPISNSVASGVKLIKYVINPQVAIEECLNAPFIPEAQEGTCENPIYTPHPFALPVGTYIVYYFSVDNVGNEEIPKLAMIAVRSFDMEPPVTSIAIDEPKYATEISTYVTGGTTFTLTAVDMPLVGASGVRFTEFRVDSGSWTLYENPFTLAQALGISEGQVMPEGIVSYWKFDEGSGITAADSVDAIHGTLMNGPDWTTGKFGNAVYLYGFKNYVNLGLAPGIDSVESGNFTYELWFKTTSTKWSFIYMSANKDLTGYYGGGNIIQFATNNGIFIALVNCNTGGAGGNSIKTGLNDGLWHHAAVVKNASGVYLYIDGNYDRQLPSYGASGDVSGNCSRPGYQKWIGAGCNGQDYYWRATEGFQGFNGSIDEFAIYNRALTEEEIKQRYLGAPIIKEGSYVISYRSIDNVDNIETIKEQTVIVDETPPKTEFTLSGNYVFADPVINGGTTPTQGFGGQAAGIEITAGELQRDTTSYGIDGSTITYVPPGYQLVYSTNPGHYILVPLATEKPSGKWLNFITSETEFVLTATDTYSGLMETKYSIGDLPWTLYAFPFTISGQDGLYEVKYQSEDNLGHLEVIKSSEVYLDNTAPTSALQITNPKYQIGDTIYISTLTEFTIISEDGTGCGIKEIKYSIDGQPWTLYASPWTLSEFSEGEHIVSYYSEDLLGNKEQVKTRKVILDKTPPITTVTSGQWPVNGEGKIYVNKNSTITLTATDNLSGIKNTLWKLNSSWWFTYENPFRLSEIPGTAPLPEGIVSYWKFDEGSGITAYDSVDAIHGTLMNGPDWTTGKLGNAVYLYGFKNYVNLGLAPEIDSVEAGNFTYELWFKTTSAKWSYIYMSANKDLTGYYGDGNIVAFATNNGVFIALVGCNTGAAGGSSIKTGLNDGLWHHASVVKNASGVYLYIDGNYDTQLPSYGASGDVSGNCSRPGYQKWIGAGCNGYDYYWRATEGFQGFNGSIDEFAIYNRALTDEEIKQRYEGEVLTEISEGEHLFSFYSIDNVQNKETPKTRTLVLDNTAPETTAQVAGTEGLNGWYVSPVTVTLVSTDALSGIKDVYYSPDSSPFVLYTLPVTESSEGAHIVKYYAGDNAGNSEPEKSLSFKIDLSAPVLSGFAAKPSAFSPSSGETVRFVFSISEKAALEVAVKNADGTAIKTLASGGQYPAGTLSFVWDGKDQSGAPAQAGNYHIAVKAVDAAGHMAEASGSVCELKGADYPAVTNLSENPDPFYPEDPDPAKNKITISYVLSAGQTGLLPVTVKISGSAGIVKTFSLEQPAGNNSVQWNGASDAGQPQPDGAYQEEITLTANGYTAKAQGAFALVRNNAYAAVSSEPEPVVTVQYADVQTDITITKDPEIPTQASLALQSLAAEGGILASPIYDITTDRALSSQPVLRFKYDPVYDGESLALYKYDATAGAWIPVAATWYADIANNEIIVTLDKDIFLASLFALVRAPDTTPPLVSLEYPSPSALGIERAISGTIPVKATISDTYISSWTLEYAPGENSRTGYIFIASGTANVSADTPLTRWDTTNLSGPYTLRLTAKDAAENISSTLANVFIGTPYMVKTIGRWEKIKIDFKHPKGIAVSPDNTIWVSDTGNDRVLQINPQGEVLTEIDGKKRWRPGKWWRNEEKEQDEQALNLNKPHGLAPDTQGNLYIADTFNHRILKISPEGQILLEISATTASADRGKTKGSPATTAPAGRHEQPVPGRKQGEFILPTDVAVDIAGMIYVADKNNARVQIFDKEGNFIRMFSTGISDKEPDNQTEPPEDEDEKQKCDWNGFQHFLRNYSRPYGIALDKQGNIWVTDHNTDKVLQFTPTGEFIKAIGRHGKEPGQFRNPQGISLDTINNIYIADTGNRRVRKLDNEGNPVLVFGNTKSKAKERHYWWSRLFMPTDLSLTPEKDLWVTDTYHNRIVRYSITPADYIAAFEPFDEQAARIRGKWGLQVKKAIFRKQGGTIKHDKGAKAEIPENSLKKDENIYIEETESPENHNQKQLKKTGTAYEYGPEGTIFDKPVTISLPYQTYNQDKEELKIAYWNPAKKEWEVLESYMDAENKLVNAKANHFSIYQVVSMEIIPASKEETGRIKTSDQKPTGLSAEFRLGEAYVFPNPAKREEKPTFHIECGIADKVNVKIYTVSGRMAYEHVITGMPQAIDDGNGLDYAYEYTIHENLPSGIYYYYIEAEKSGRKLKAKGKFAVIR